MNTSITKKLAGTVALVTGGSRCIGAAIVRRLAADGADVASVFVTNGGYNGVQQVLRLSTRLYRQTATNARFRTVTTIQAKLAHR